MCTESYLYIAVAFIFGPYDQYCFLNVDGPLSLNADFTFLLSLHVEEGLHCLFPRLFPYIFCWKMKSSRHIWLSQMTGMYTVYQF